MDTRRATLLLQRMDGGDAAAADELFPLLYDELRRVARGVMDREVRSHTLQPTALVHEAWMRLVDAPAAGASCRNHFLSLAARVMRRVLVDHARRRQAAKRGGEAQRLPADALDGLTTETGVDLLALDEALAELAQEDAQLARIVELRFFAGLGNRDVADVEQTSLRSVERAWSLARSWLQRRLAEAG